MLPQHGIHPTQAILFGSFARDQAHKWSDIDLIVIAPEFDGPRERRLVRNLWHATLKADKRIEPIPCGKEQWETDTGIPVYEIARRDGIAIVA